MADFLVHRGGDHVGIAVSDVPKGRTSKVLAMDTLESTTVEVRQDIPAGHKVALTDIEKGAGVVEYGVVIGIATSPIARGDLVHVHNIRSKRW